MRLFRDESSCEDIFRTSEKKGSCSSESQAQLGQSGPNEAESGPKQDRVMWFRDESQGPL